ncbi:unnamed protein product [Agarophyton chilense]
MKGHRVSVHRHQHRVGLFSGIALLTFLVIEVITSYLSDPADRRTVSQQPCFALDSIILRPAPSGLALQEDFVSFKCVDFRGSSILLKPGNFSMEEERVKCSQAVVLEFDADSSKIPFEYPLEGSERSTLKNPAPNPLLHCSEGDCVVVRTNSSVESTVIRLSLNFKEANLSELRKTRAKVPILVTKVFFNASDLMPQIADRALEAFRRNVNTPLELNRRIYMGSEETLCPFDRNLGAATQIPLSLIVVISITWLLSFLVWIVSFVLRTSVFYDISNPIHWAKRTKFSIGEEIRGDPRIYSVYEEGQFVVYVSD